MTLNRTETFQLQWYFQAQNQFKINLTWEEHCSSQQEGELFSIVKIHGFYMSSLLLNFISQAPNENYVVQRVDLAVSI